MSEEGLINSLSNTLLLKRFENELEYLTSVINNNDYISTSDNNSEHSNNEYIRNRIEQLEQIINNIITVNESKNINGYMKEIDKYIYKKPWTRLQPYHRTIKIKEYIENTYTDAKFKKKLLNDLIKLINDNKLNSNKMVKYDPYNEKILSIPAIKLDPSNISNYQIKL